MFYHIIAHLAAYSDWCCTEETVATVCSTYCRSSVYSNLFVNIYKSRQTIGVNCGGVCVVFFFYFRVCVYKESTDIIKRTRNILYYIQEYTYIRFTYTHTIY